MNMTSTRPRLNRFNPDSSSDTNSTSTEVNIGVFISGAAVPTGTEHWPGEHWLADNLKITRLSRPTTSDETTSDEPCAPRPACAVGDDQWNMWRAVARDVAQAQARQIFCGASSEFSRAIKTWHTAAQPALGLWHRQDEAWPLAAVFTGLLESWQRSTIPATEPERVSQEEDECPQRGVVALEMKRPTLAEWEVSVDVRDLPRRQPQLGVPFGRSYREDEEDDD